MNTRRLKTPEGQDPNEKGRQVFLTFAYRIIPLAFFLIAFAFLALPRQSLADRTETKDSITYSTDPEMDRVMEERAREEKEKEAKAWQMLQNMNIYKDMQKRPPRRPQPDNTPSQ